MICKNCNIEFETQSRVRKYCNRECAKNADRESQRKYRIANREKMRILVKKWNEKNLTPERKKKWKVQYEFGGLRELVLERDGYKCCDCGMSNAKHKEKWNREITIDHIDRNKRNNTMENLRTLCMSCHGAKDGGANIAFRWEGSK